jgi:hypothetical protein
MVCCDSFHNPVFIIIDNNRVRASKAAAREHVLVWGVVDLDVGARDPRVNARHSGREYEQVVSIIIRSFLHRKWAYPGTS